MRDCPPRFIQLARSRLLCELEISRMNRAVRELIRPLIFTQTEYDRKPLPVFDNIMYGQVIAGCKKPKKWNPNRVQAAAPPVDVGLTEH